MDARAQLVLRLLRVLVLASALWVAIEMLDLRGPDPDVPPHVLLDERLHSEEPPMTRRWRCIVIVMLCCRFFDTPRHGIVFPQRAQMNAGIRFSAPGVLNTSSIARSISHSR